MNKALCLLPVEWVGGLSCWDNLTPHILLPGVLFIPSQQAATWAPVGAWTPREYTYTSGGIKAL